MRINTNVSSLNAQARNVEVQKNIASSLEKLSSGLAINKAADNGSGLAISDKLRTQTASITQGIKNANSAVAMIQIADKAMDEQSNILNTVKTKLVEAATDTTTSDGRAAVLKDIQKLLEQFDNIAQQTNYNGTKLLNGDNGTLTFQVGEDSSYDITAVNNKSDLTLGATSGAATQVDTITLTALSAGGSDDGDSLTVTVGSTEYTVTVGDVVNGTTVDGGDTIITAMAYKINADGASSVVATTSVTSAGANAKLVLTSKTDGASTFAATLADTGGVTVAIAHTTAGSDGSDSLQALKGLTTMTAANANSFMATIDTALSELNTNRANLGSTQNQLESHIRNASVATVYLKSAESVIRDVDYAAETANFNKNNIIAQAGMYAISQANSAQQNIQKLLQ